MPKSSGESSDPGRSVANESSSANATLMPVEKRLPKNNTEVLEALLAKFPDSPTVCLRRRNVLDAYVSLYRAEHGDARAPLPSTRGDAR